MQCDVLKCIFKVGQSRFTVCMENNTIIINTNTGINFVFHALTMVNLLWPHPVYSEMIPHSHSLAHSGNHHLI